MLSTAPIQVVAGGPKTLQLGGWRRHFTSKIKNLVNHSRTEHDCFHMQFEYEIPVEEYAAAQMLLNKGRVVKQVFGCILFGLFLS